MVTGKKLSAGSESSITSIATGNNSQSIHIAKFETTADGSGVALKVRKPYTISKQREKWTEEEHQKFIGAVKLYGRAWLQIAERIGTKTPVQIRSHAQKFFTKVMKEGSSSKEASIEPVEIPPPRPKRKSSHPYPRKNGEAPSSTGSYANEIFSILKTMNGASHSHSPNSVLAPEGSLNSTSRAKDLGSGSPSPISSGSNLSHVAVNNNIKDIMTALKEKEKEGNLSLTLNLSGPSMNELAFMKTTVELKDADLFKNDNAFPESHIKFGSLKTIKLFGQSVVAPNPLEYSDCTSNTLVHAAAGNPSICNDSRTDPPMSKLSQTHASIPKSASNLDSHLAPDDLGIGETVKVKDGPVGISCTSSTSNAFSEPGKAETDQDSVDSKNKCSLQLRLNPNDCRKGFVPYKRLVSNREAASLMSTGDDSESHLIRLRL